MKTLGQIMLAAIVLAGCARGLNPGNTAKVEAAFAKYEDSEGKSIFRAKCGKCHGYMLPEKHTAEKWPGIMSRMARKAKLTDEQKEAVLAFVTKHAKAS